MIQLDGSIGEGGGQIIRSALALSLWTGKPFSVKNIRAGRQKPGLQNQHLTAVRAAATIGSARVEGERLGAGSFTFHPGQIRPGQYHFDIGTAGSTMLVLQTILPPLMAQDCQSHLVLSGGTHNTQAPPFDFISQTFLPLVETIGPKVTCRLEKYGFYPPGGGKVEVRIIPSTLKPVHIGRRGQCTVSARALVVNLPEAIGQRELKVIKQILPEVAQCSIESSRNAVSPGNVVLITADSRALSETFTAIGERGLPAEKVATRASQEAKAYLATSASVGEHLADQLLIPMAMAGGGSFYTVKPTLHTETNIEVIRMFLDVRIQCEEPEKGLFQIIISNAAASS